MLNTLN